MSQPRSKYGSYSSRYSDMGGVDLMSGDISIEADGDFGTGPIDVDDEDLNAAFEAEHGSMFTVIDEVRDGETAEEKRAVLREKGVEKKKFVIPKVKQSENDEQVDMSYSSGDERKREWRKNERQIRPRDDGGKRDRGGKDAGKKERDVRERDTRKRDHDDRRDKKESRGERGRHYGELSREAQNGQSSETASDVKSNAGKRQNLFESFAKEGLIAEEHHIVTSGQAAREREDRTEGGIGTTPTMKEDSQIPGDEDAALEIPMGRDSLVFVRDYHVWQVRLHPISKTDMARADFVQMWSMADSSSVVWSSHKDFGGVAEFLLKDQSSIQKFMRKIMWHNFSSEIMTVEVTEREKSKLSEHDDSDTLDAIANQMTFKYSNTRARQLIKTYYPTPQGEVTERSVYVNNINSGKAVNLLKAVFPCAAKISVARSTKETSSALVETASVEEARNYLVVYLQMDINSHEVLLSTVHSDWEGAKKQYEEKEASKKKTTESSKPSGLKTSDSASGKRTAEAAASNRPAKRGKGQTNPVRKEGPVRSRGAASSRGTSRGRGGRAGVPAPGRKPGRPLLPDPPMGGGDGLLPLPGPPEPMMGGGDGLLPRPDHLKPPALMGLPVQPTPKGLIEGERLGPPEADYHTMELKEIQQELESRVMETRAQLESQLSKLNQAYRTGLPPKPRRPVDYMEEEDQPRDAPRRTLLSVEGRPRSERDEWLDEPAEYRRPAPVRPAPPPLPPPPPPPPALTSLDRGYDTGGSYSRMRPEEDYGDVRLSRPRPYLLEAPPEQVETHEKPDEREVYDYEHAHRRPRMEPEVHHDDTRPLLSRPSLTERDRSMLGGRDYPEERIYSSRDRYDYEEVETRRAPSYGGYEEDRRRLAARYKDEYERRY